MATSPENENPYQSPKTASRPAPAKKSVGEFALCPMCGHNAATRIGWTLWGGALGPWLFTHVKCDGCAAKFNGKTGQSNTSAIALYVGVSLGLAVLFFFAALLFGLG